MNRTSGTAGEAMDAIGVSTNITSRKKQMAHLNRMRQWVYSQQNELGLEIIQPLCVPVLPYKKPCTGSCSDSWSTGFRLPFNYQSINIIEWSNQSVELYSRRISTYDGVAIGLPFDGSEGVKVFRRGNHPLECDLQKNSKLRITWMPKCKDDPEFSFNVKGWSNGLDKLDRKIDLTGEGVIETEESWSEIADIRFLKKLNGTLIIEDEEGGHLGEFHVGDTPGFTQYEVISSRCVSRLRVEANLSYKPVTDENDLVEFGDTLIWELLSKYLHNLLKDKRDSSERVAMQEWLSVLVGMIKGSQEVLEGETDMQFHRKPIAGTFGLSGSTRVDNNYGRRSRR